MKQTYKTIVVKAFPNSYTWAKALGSRGIVRISLTSLGVVALLSWGCSSTSVEVPASRNLSQQGDALGGTQSQVLLTAAAYTGGDGEYHTVGTAQ